MNYILFLDFLYPSIHISTISNSHQLQKQNKTKTLPGGGASYSGLSSASPVRSGVLLGGGRKTGEKEQERPELGETARPRDAGPGAAAEGGLPFGEDPIPFRSSRRQEARRTP